MDTKASSSFWWLKSSTVQSEEAVSVDNAALTPKQDVDISSSLAEFLEKEQTVDKESYEDTDIASILEEINRVAAQSPLGPYEKATNGRSVEEIMREAERIFQESSKSFEQLSARSKTSQNITDLNSKSSKNSTPTPKSVSPLPLDGQIDIPVKDSDAEDSYSEDFSIASKTDVNPPSEKDFSNEIETEINEPAKSDNKPAVVTEIVNSPSKSSVHEETISPKVNNNETYELAKLEDSNDERKLSLSTKVNIFQKEEVVRVLEQENTNLRMDIQEMKAQLKESNMLLEKTKQALQSKSLQSPEINLELERTLEELKDTKEVNTALQLQLDNLNKSYQTLKISYEEVLTSNKNLERRVAEVDTILAKYKTELANLRLNNEKLAENEKNLSNSLEIEKQHVKTLKFQNEKDAKCILDLNRQIKEMERIIMRKHPDSVSSLIVAAKSDTTESNIAARKALEDRIKTLEHEASTREEQSSKIFLEVQEKFSQIKQRYENHIEDLELHVADLKNQLKRKVDTYDIYTQTSFDGEQKIPEKETTNKSVQTETNKPSVKLAATKRVEKVVEPREETHLLATIRGLQADLINKERAVNKLQKELEDLRTTNKRLQKEREGSLRNLSDKRHFSSYPEKLALQTRNGGSTGDLTDKVDDELRAIRSERDKMKLQLCRIEGDYQSLKAKRLQDLSALQEAHEREIATYLSNITPLREQLEVQQVSLSTLQNQLSAAKEELAIITVERDHLNNRLNTLESLKLSDVNLNSNSEQSDEVTNLKRRMLHMEKRFEERELRLRAIVHGLAQKNITNRSCEQCAARQQQLIGYKVELDQLLATVRSLQ